ncbi:MAG: DNA mismatch repair protein MutS [Clostridiales bacterium]|nr:DNA mismatch repair protein MutS [Clostridiales bacterium]
MEDLSPMMKHYLSVKEEYKDCIIFYRLGDFYEMFFDDAIKVSKLLDLTLTGRNCGLKERAPMCGVPFHAADLYISKLLSFGEKVAICEQTTAPNGKDLVNREVVKIATAGTITNNELISEKNNNFLASIYLKKDSIALAWADITTGEFLVRNFSNENSSNELFDTLVRISPVEIICNDDCKERFIDSPLIKHGILPKFSAFSQSEYNLNNATNTLKRHFNILNFNAFGIEKSPECISACGALIAYLNQTQKQTLININKIKFENDDAIMMLDINAIRNLELVKTLRDGKTYGSLLWLLDKTKTSMGARKLQSQILSPLVDKEKINYRLDAVDCLFNDSVTRQSLANLLCSIRDVQRLTGKISSGNIMPRDCLALKSSLEVLPSLKFKLLGLNSAFIQDIFNSIEDFNDTTQLIDSAIVSEPPSNMKDGGYIKDGYDANLDEMRNLGKNSKSLIAQIENNEREKTGIKTLKIGYNRVFGYYIEVTNSFKDKVPYEYQRKQTLSNAERFITDELKELEVAILSSEEKSLQIEANIFNKIKEHLRSQVERLLSTANAIADLDVICSLATVAKENGYSKPIILDAGNKLDIVDGRHPVVESFSKQKFIPNDCLLDSDENRTMILTGPNMAGKSTYMRQIAIITLLAQMGSFVPAKSAEIPITDKIFTRIGASDNLISDQSTFMVEMSEMANILNNATKNSLLILDEIGRGTSTFDGLSIAWAVVEYITNNIKARTMFATHYHELTTLEGSLEGVKNYKVTVKELQGGIVFMRKIMRGGTNKSFGIEVAQLAGVNKEIIDKSKEILKKLEKSNINNDKISVQNIDNPTKTLSEVEKIIAELDTNNLSPMQAFNILIDLQEKVKEE